MSAPRPLRLALHVFAVLCLTAWTAIASEDRLHVVVLHTNDIHGQVLPRKATWLKRADPPMVGGLPRVAACVKRVRAEVEAAGGAVLVVDGGDWFQGTPEGLIDGGLGFVNALAGVGYDALCVGNHEFDHGIPNLVDLIRKSALPAVAANLDERTNGRRVEWVPPWRLVERGGLRIALVGLVTPATPEITHPDAQTLIFVDPAEALARVKQELVQGVDWILPLTHLGIGDDKALARAHPDLSLIVGGHSHTFLKEGEREGSTLIVQTGAKASAVGRVDLWFDRATRKVVESRATLIDLDTEPAPSEGVQRVVEACADLVRRSDARMSEVIGELAGPLTRAKDPLASSPAGNFLADAVRAHGVADVGIMNRGGIRADLEAGPVTRRMVFEIAPFENNLTVLTMTGAELWSMVQRAVEGKGHSGIEVSGVVLDVHVEAEGQWRLTGVEVGGQPLDRARDYRVATNSFLADGGDAYAPKALPGPRRKDDPILIRDLLEQVFVHKKCVVPSAENRYRVTRNP